MSYTNHGEDLVLDTMFEVAGLYVGLSTADPGEDEAGLAEPAGNGYARVSVSAATWNAASGGSKTNALEVTFPAASGNWGTVTHAFVADAETSGNIIISNALSASKTITSGQTPRFPAASITFTQA
jgi:hypothetical protein